MVLASLGAGMMDNDQTPPEPSRDEVIRWEIGECLEDLDDCEKCVWMSQPCKTCVGLIEEINELKRGLSDHAC